MLKIPYTKSRDGHGSVKGLFVKASAFSKMIKTYLKPLSVLPEKPFLGLSLWLDIAYHDMRIAYKG